MNVKLKNCQKFFRNFEPVWGSKTIVFSRENAKIWQFIGEISVKTAMWLRPELVWSPEFREKCRFFPWKWSKIVRILTLKMQNLRENDRESIENVRFSVKTVIWRPWKRFAMFLELNSNLKSLKIMKKCWIFPWKLEKLREIGDPASV